MCGEVYVEIHRPIYDWAISLQIMIMLILIIIITIIYVKTTIHFKSILFPKELTNIYYPHFLLFGILSVKVNLKINNFWLHCILRKPELTLGCRSMLERIHERQFRTRLWPCFQSRNDPFRIFLYDVATAAKQLGDAEPLLTRRHNVVPGMFLVSLQWNYIKIFYCTLHCVEIINVGKIFQTRS